MADEQIKQNAIEYLERITNERFNPKHYSPCWDGIPDNFMGKDIEDAYLAGAHSRDEEIKQLEESKRKLRLRLMQQIHELRNPWHKASEELPPISEPCDESYDCVLAVLGRHIYIGGKIYLTGFYDHQIRDWHIYGNGYSKMTNLEVIDWMPIPKLKKGE